MSGTASRRRGRATLALALGGIVLAGCGADGSGSGTAAVGSGLGVQVRWASVASECGENAIPATLPAAVSRIRVLVSAGGERCCVKFDPRSDLLEGARHVVLTDLPEGDATVDVTGFAARRFADMSFADTLVPDDGADRRCAIADPVGLGEDCDQTACAATSFSLDQPVTTTLRAGREATVVACEIARPYFVSTTPACDDPAGDNPVLLDVVFAQVTNACGCDDERLLCGDDPEDRTLADVQIEVFPKAGPGSGTCSGVAADPARGPARSTLETFVCCRDDATCLDTESCCSGPSADEQALTGVRAQLTVFDLPLGCAEVRVASELPGATADPVIQSFAVGALPPTPTVTLTPTSPTPTPTFTIQSPTPTPTFTTEIPTPTPTETSDGGVID